MGYSEQRSKGRTFGTFEKNVISNAAQKSRRVTKNLPGFFTLKIRKNIILLEKVTSKKSFSSRWQVCGDNLTHGIMILTV